jgi:cyclophilin family peptidyl-prolyl cis-trans isomerase
MTSIKNVFRLSIAYLAIVALALSITAVTTNPVMAGDDTKKKKEDEIVRVLMKTTMGDIVLGLNRTKAPISVDNFLRYVDEGFYASTIFHRVMSTFMIQGGGFTADMEQKKPHDPIQNEWENGLKNKRGSIAMARTPAPHSATSQFYINVVDNPGLDQPSRGAAYAVFGEVLEGMDTVDKIKKVAVTTKGMHQNVPVEPVVIEKAVRVNEEGDEIKLEKKTDKDE